MKFIIILFWICLFAKIYCSSHKHMNLETAILIIAAADESCMENENDYNKIKDAGKDYIKGLLRDNKSFIDVLTGDISDKFINELLNDNEKFMDDIKIKDKKEEIINKISLILTNLRVENYGLNEEEKKLIATDIYEKFHKAIIKTNEKKRI